MDYFCQECSSKPGWPFDPAKAFTYACQRCFRHTLCNDYAWRKVGAQKIEPAPNKPGEMKRTNINPDAECKLPPAQGVPVEPVPVYPVNPPPHIANAAPDDRNEADKALDTIYPNRPGIKLQTTKGGSKAAAKAPEPKFEVAADNSAV